MGFISDIIGGFASNNAANQANAAANQDTSALNQVFGQESGLINNIAQQYYGQGGGAQTLNGLSSFLSGNLGQTYSNPYSQAASGAANNLSAGGNNPYMSGAANSASQLQNFQGLSGPELAALQQSTANSGMSTINNLRNQSGGGANQNALISSLIGQNNQNTLGQGIQLGSLASQQQLGAQESAGNLLSGLSGQSIGAQTAGMQGNTALSGQNLDYLQQMISGLLGTTGQQSALLGSGIGGLQGMANTYQNLASGAANRGYQDQQNAMQDFTGATNGAANLFTGGAAGAGGIGSILGGGGGW